MIVGNGDIASVLPDRDDLLFFASGVSNSQETDEAAYQREADLMVDQDSSEHVVYFSSLAVLEGASRYILHKRQMERLAKQFDKYTIVRLGNITWGDNPHTLINHLKLKMAAGEEYEVRDVWRYIVSEEEFRHWIDRIPPWSCEMSIPGERMKVKDVVWRIERGLL